MYCKTLRLLSLALGASLSVRAQAVADSRFVTQSVPPTLTMTAGQPYSVSIKMRNVGTATWTAAGGYQLVAQRPVDNATWGVNRVPLPVSVPPGGDVTFDFTVTAPNTPGTYNFEWRMAQTQLLTGFGDFSPVLQMTVVANPNSPPSTLNWQSVPGLDAFAPPA